MNIHSRCKALLNIIMKGISTHCYHSNCFCIRSVHFPYILCCFKSTHYRHHNIHENNLVLSILRCFKYFNSFFPIDSRHNLCTGSFYYKSCNFHIKLIIFSNNNFISVKPDFFICRYFLLSAFI